MKHLGILIDKALTHSSIFFIKLYQYTLSPDKGIFSPVLKGKICSHQPHCSEYAIKTLKRYGFWKGIGKVTDRILHCKPSMEKQYDPEHYRIVFFSSAPIGVPFLEQLAKDKHFEIVGVVTQADKPVGRGLQVQENVIKVKAKELITNTTVRYFFLKKSLQEKRITTFSTNNIQWSQYEDRGIIVYAQKDQHKKLVHFFQTLLLPGPWYFDTSGANHLIVFKDAIFDLDNNENEAAKAYGHKLHIPEEQLNRPDNTSVNLHKEIIQTPLKINPDKSLEGKVFYDRLKEKNPDFLVVIAYGKILPQSVLDTAHFGAINVHGSLLPKYRGASPLQSIFLNKEKKSGLTIMKMDAGMDTGDMIDSFNFPIPFHRTVVELIKALEQKGPKFLNNTLRNYGKGLIIPEKQNEQEATYCQKIEKVDGNIDPFKDSLEEIYAKYRAFTLRPKIRFTLNNKTIIIEKLKLNETSWEQHKNQPLITEKKLNPCIENIAIKPEGKKEMNRENFVNGYIK